MFEHVCHHRDSNDTYLKRFRCVASRPLVYIESLERYRHGRGTSLYARVAATCVGVFVFGRKKLSDYPHQLAPKAEF